MTTKGKRRPKRRATLTKERVLQTAIALVDEGGIESLSMRKLAQELEVEAMSLYNHVANKDEIIDGIIEMVVGEIYVPAEGVDWKIAMRARAISAHRVLLGHPWACALIESRASFSHVKLQYFDAVIGSLRGGGFSIEMAYKAFITMDSYIYGFILQEVSWPFDGEDGPNVAATAQMLISADEYPHVTEIMRFVMSSRARTSSRTKRATYEAEFAYGLDLILDALEKAPAR